MSLYQPIVALVNNDTTYNLNVTLNGKPLPLTGYTPKAYQKATATTPDASAIVYQVGSGLTVVNSNLGQLRLVIPHANLTTPGSQWWRLDLIDTNGGVYTVFYGTLTIKSV
jgi:hypothetical protein